MNLVTCTNCGWVHVLITKDEAQRAVDRFNEYYSELPYFKREHYNAIPASLDDYLHCFRCGSAEPMRWFQNGDCPTGVTIQATALAPSEPQPL